MQQGIVKGDVLLRLAGLSFIVGAIVTGVFNILAPRSGDPSDVQAGIQLIADNKGFFQVDQLLLRAYANDFDAGREFLVRVGWGQELEPLFQIIGAPARKLGSQQVGEQTAQQAAGDHRSGQAQSPRIVGIGEDGIGIAGQVGILGQVLDCKDPPSFSLLANLQTLEPLQRARIYSCRPYGTARRLAFSSHLDSLASLARSG